MTAEDPYAVAPAIRLAGPRAVGCAKSHADMLHRLQCNSFAYFVHEATSHGLVLDKTATDWPARLQQRFDIVYCLYEHKNGGTYRSEDKGETWTKIEGGPSANCLAYAPDGSTVFAINYEGVHRSNDGGLTWSNVGTGLDLSSNTLEDVQVSDREALILLRGFGQPSAVYRLPLNGTTWQRVPIEADVTAQVGS